MYTALIVVLLSLELGVAAQDQPTVERSFTFPDAAVKAAVMHLHAAEGRLPSLADFAQVGADESSRFTLPYYRLQVDVKARDESSSIVRVSARITALYTEIKHAEYRSVASNGRLEQDFLERLTRELQREKQDQRVDPKSLESDLADLRSKRHAAEQKRDALIAEIHSMEQTAQQASLSRLVGPSKERINVLPKPSARSSVLFRAQRHDDFEVLAEANGWTEVRLDGGSAGWISTSDLHSIETTAGFAIHSDDFEVVREDVSNFSGTWAKLKGQPTLFLWVRRRDGVAAPDLWAYARELFLDRSNTPANIAGIVVVFLGDGEVAAATLRDIHSWQQGAMSDVAFQRLCSLDPPNAFALHGSVGSSSNAKQAFNGSDR
jgi:SH3-like domain-containing protein